jgi:hypothetical protein
LIMLSIKVIICSNLFQLHHGRWSLGTEVELWLNLERFITICKLFRLHISRYDTCSCEGRRFGNGTHWPWGGVSVSRRNNRSDK